MAQANLPKVDLSLAADFDEPEQQPEKPDTPQNGGNETGNSGNTDNGNSSDGNPDNGNADPDKGNSGNSGGNSGNLGIPGRRRTYGNGFLYRLNDRDSGCSTGKRYHHSYISGLRLWRLE